ncbi:MAG: TCP-1/cpn60 chaperonin family protein [Candidatus Bathyarchaeia archaeon]
MTQPDSRLQPLKHERVPVPEIYVEGKPALVLDKRTKRRTKEEARDGNLSAVQFMQDLAKTIYGPRRLIKVISTQDGNYPMTFITSDLQSVLKRIQLKHPAAQLIAGAAIATYREKGDGCVSTLLLAASILTGCRRLLARKTHVNTVIDGLSLAYKRTMKKAPRLALAGRNEPIVEVRQAIKNSLEGKLSPQDHDVICKLLFRAVEIVGLSNLDGPDADAIVDVKKVTGASLAESQIVEGVVLTQEIPHDRMPRRVEHARIALIQGELRIPNKKISRYQDYSFEFDSPEKLSGFDKSKETFLEGRAANIIETGANVILVSEGVDDLLLEYFADRGILVIRRFPPVEFERVNRILGGRRITNPLIITREDLGSAELVEERKLGKDKLIFISGCSTPKSVDILLRGNVNWVLDDIERVMKGAIKSATAVAKNPRMVWGGGAFEQEIARDLYDYAESIADRRQLVVRLVAEAFESLPAMLAETVGMTAVDVTTELRHRHAKGDKSAGVDVMNNRIARMSTRGIRDSLDIKLQVITTAFETAITLLRIDDLIIAPDLPAAERHYLERIRGTSRKALKAKGAPLTE